MPTSTAGIANGPGPERCAPAPLTEADIWRAYQVELRERGEPHHDPWGINPFERR